jgi:solute carrier family 25 phosphate transporter 23/24/25/41
MSSSSSSSSSGLLGETFATAFAGGLSGCISKTFTAPLSRITILYQVHGTASWPSPSSLGITTMSHAGLASQSVTRPVMRPAPAHIFDAMRLVVKREGLLSLWKGNWATLLHRIPYSAVNFVVFERSDQLLAQLMSSNEGVGTSGVNETDGNKGRGMELRKFLAGGLAGIAGCSAAYPLDLVRTRLSASFGSSSSGKSHHRYEGVSHALRSIVKEEGWSGLYRGLPATLTQVSPALALNFGFYSNFKQMLSSAMSTSKEDGSVSSASFSPLVSTTAASLAGLCGSTMTFPLDKIRRLVQMESVAAVKGGDRGCVNGTESGWKHHAISIWRRGGVRAFYAGITAEYMKVVPGMVVAFTTFEFIKTALGVKQDVPKAHKQLASTSREDRGLKLDDSEAEVLLELLSSVADES